MKKECLGYDPPATAGAEANRPPLGPNQAQVEFDAAKWIRMSAKGPPWLIAALVAFVCVAILVSRLIP